jgi:hypothetical protein
VLHVRKFRDLDFCRRIAAQVTGDDFARNLVRTKNTLEEAFGRGFVALPLQQVHSAVPSLKRCPTPARTRCHPITMSRHAQASSNA